MSKTYDFTMTMPQLDIFLEKIKDLLGIDKDNQVNVRMDKKNLLIYSLVGERRIVTAFKSFIFDIGDILNMPDIGDDTLRYIVMDGKRYEATMRNFLNYDDDLSGQFYVNEESFVDNLRIKNKKLKLNFNGGDSRALTVDIDVNRIKEIVKIGDENFKFQLNKANFDQIKKLSKIEVQEENPILNLVIKNKVLSIGEYNWDLDICDMDFDDTSLTFPKKFFNSISFGSDDEVTVYIFDSFLFIDNKITNLLIALEISI